MVLSTHVRDPKITLYSENRFYGSVSFGKRCSKFQNKNIKSILKNRWINFTLLYKYLSCSVLNQPAPSELCERLNFNFLCQHLLGGYSFFITLRSRYLDVWANFEHIIFENEALKKGQGCKILVLGIE